MYTFAFLQLPLPAELPTGWNGKPIDCIEVHELAAAVDPSLPWEQVQYDDQQLLQAALLHDRVICDLFRQQPVLPLQFGTIFVSSEGLVRHLTRARERYLSRIRSLSGMGEYTLKLAPQLWHPELDDSDFYPDDELSRLQAQLRACYASVVDGAPQQGVERLHLLIPVCEETKLRETVNAWQNEYHCWQLDISGPLPPYHFA